MLSLGRLDEVFKPLMWQTEAESKQSFTDHHQHLVPSVMSLEDLTFLGVTEKWDKDYS